MGDQKKPTSLANIDEAAEQLLLTVQGVVSELHPGRVMGRPITLDDSLDKDLGLDSLSRVELLARVEKEFGIALPEQVFAEAETPGDLLRALVRARPVQPTPILLLQEVKKEVKKIEMGRAEPTPHSVQTLVQVLEWHVRSHPDRPHIQLYEDDGEGEVITYRQLKEGAAAVAGGLQYHGVAAGQKVAIMLPSVREYFFSFFGILLAGAVPVPIYPPTRLSQLEDHLRRQQAILDNGLTAILITMPEAARVAGFLMSRVESLRRVTSVEELTDRSETWVEPAIDRQDTAFLQYTSGSTGNPKGVVLSHANLLANIRAIGDVVKTRANDVVVSWLPLYHDMGLIGSWLFSLYYSMLFVVMSPLSFLTRPKRWLWAISRYRGTLSASPNFGYELCLQRIQDEELAGLDLSSWRVAVNGAEPVSPETVERFCRRFCRYGFQTQAMKPVYGLAESSVGLAFPPMDQGPLIDRIQRDPFMRHGQALQAMPEDTNALRFFACGFPLPAHQIRVVDSAGREVPERQEGRLEFRGPSSTSGYFRNREQTQRLFHGHWLVSGDLAYVADGQVFITGRTKDVIIRAGRNIYPHELEQAVGEIPEIRNGRVVVFGSKDSKTGTERLVVLAETREKDPRMLDDLRARINAVAMDLVGAPPDDVVLAPPDTVLKTSSGKLRRAASRDLYEDGAIGKAPKAVWRQLVRLWMSGLAIYSRRIRRRLAEAIFATYAWTVFAFLAPIIWLSVVSLPVFSWRWEFMRYAGRALAGATRIPLNIRGLENLPPRGTPFVLVSNHASYLDVYVVVASIPRHLSFVAKAELARSELTCLPLRRIGTEFVERFDAQKGASDADRLHRALKKGRPLIFFPEGTFTRIPGLLPFHMGAFLAAAQAGVPLVPIAIRGTRSMLRSGSWFPRHGTITVTVGEAIDPHEIQPKTQANPWTVALQLRDQAREHILRYCGEPDLGHEKPQYEFKEDQI